MKHKKSEHGPGQQCPRFSEEKTVFLHSHPEIPSQEAFGLCTATAKQIHVKHFEWSPNI